MKLAQDWIASTGGEFKGDKSCGCEPAHYSIRVSSTTEMNLGPVHNVSTMPSVDVPIKFEDDGTFTGDGTANFQAAGTAGPCSTQASNDLAFHVSGQAIETAEQQSMHFQFENSSPMANKFAGQCPYVSVANQDTTSYKVTLPFDFKGTVGEAVDQPMPVAVPGVVSNMHVEIVKQE